MLPRLLACLLIGIGFLCASGCQSNPAGKGKAQLSASESQGELVFRSHCAVCHNAASSQPLHGPGLKDLFHKKYLPSGMPANDERVRETILLGRPNMPPFGPVLNEEQVRNLIAYLHTL